MPCILQYNNVCIHYFEPRLIMKQTPYILLFICLLFQNAVQGQDDWKLKKDKNGIKVYSRKTKNFKFDQLKVECEFEGRLSQLAAILFDVDNQYKWVYKTAKSQLLKQVTAADVFYYSEIECPWPFENRDMISRMTVTQNKANKVMTLVAKSVDDYLPAKKNLVRLKYSNAVWTVTPLNNSHFKIDYTIQIDPGDGAPAWLLNMFASDGPYESFCNLKEKLKSPQYISAKFPSVID